MRSGARLRSFSGAANESFFCRSEPCLDYRSAPSVIMDTRGIILEISPGLSALFGTGISWIGRNFKFAIRADDREKYDEIRKSVLKTLKPRVCALDMYHPNGWSEMQLTISVRHMNIRRARVVVVQVTGVT